MDQDKLKQIVRICQQSVVQAFDTMFPMPFEQKDVDYEQGTARAQGRFEVVGVIGVTGDCKGSVSIHVQKTLGAKLAKLLLGMDTVEDESDIYDTVGEFANIVVGGAKTMAAADGIDFDITVPTVIRSETSALVEPSNGSHVALAHFIADGEELVIMAALVS